MRVEMMVNEKMLPALGIAKITTEMEKRLMPTYPDVRIRIRQGPNNKLDIYAKTKDERNAVNKTIETMFNEADEWLND